jgi:tetratricopeptide (TPR) repeat protein
LSAAQGDLDEALRLSESMGEIVLVRRIAYALAAGRWDIVRANLQKHDSDEMVGVWRRQLAAHFHVHLGEFDRAEAAYRKSLPARLETDEGLVASRSAKMLHALAELLALKGDPKAARREAERVLEIQPEGPFCLYFAGLFAIRDGDIPAAERQLQALEEVTKVARGPLVPHYRDALLAEIALARGRPSEAQPLLEKAVGSGKLNYEMMQFNAGPIFRDGLARTYLAAGQEKKAAEVLEGLLTDALEGVHHPVIQIRALYTLGILKLELGDRARGRELLQKFLAHWGKADWDLPEVRDARARLASLTRTRSVQAAAPSS